MSSVIHERVQEFSPEFAGQRVGWVDTTTVRDEPSDRLVSVDLVAATVGLNGAWQGFQNHTFATGENMVLPEQEGFICVTAISAYFSPGNSDRRDEANLQYYAEPKLKGDRGGEFLTRGLARTPTPQLEKSKTWGTSRPELLEILKYKLEAAGIKDEYARVYYWLNGSLLRGKEKSSQEFKKIGIKDLLLPDPKMERQTAEQLFQANGIANELIGSVENNNTMRKRLTVFSDVSARDIPEVFVESRRGAAAREQNIRAYAAGLAVQRLVYMPIGASPSGRSWPYMDAGEQDESRAFGRELAGLRGQSIGCASYELERELRELERRLEYASAGRQRFAELLQAEQAA